MDTSHRGFFEVAGSSKHNFASRARLSIAFLAAAVLLQSAAGSAADMFPSATLPLQDEGNAGWNFSGDIVVGMVSEKKDGQWMGRFTAYSLNEPKLLWHLDQSLGDPDLDAESRLFPDPVKNQWYIGTGPLSRLDLETGKLLWTVPCDEIGFVNPAHARFLSGDRILVMGSKKCKQSSDYDAMKEPSFAMLDANTGKILWRYETKSYEYELALGYWARVAKFQGRRVAKDKRIQLESMLASTKAATYDLDAPEPEILVIAGERFEGVNLADGSPRFKTKDKVGILRGAFGGRVFFREGDDVTAFDAPSGAVAWTYDLKKKGATIYTVDDLVEMDHGVPAGLRDIMISESEIVSRVSVDTGKALWTVKRGGLSWQGSSHALLTKGDDKTIAYDWNTGAKLWESKIGQKPKGYDAGDFIVFVDGGEGNNAKLVPPYKLTVANGKTGQIVWSKKDVNGKKITGFTFDVPGQIRLQSERGVDNVNVADGTPATAPEGAASRFFTTFSAKGVECRDWSGNVVWTRKGEAFSIPRNQPRNGLIFWATKDGLVEVIGEADGATKWQTKAGKEPQFSVNLKGTYMVVQNKKDVTIVKLTP